MEDEREKIRKRKEGKMGMCGGIDIGEIIRSAFNHYIFSSFSPFYKTMLTTFL